MSIPDVAFKYIPPLGMGSSLLFSTNIMHPGFFKSVFGDRAVVPTNVLWFNAHLGVGLYLYSRKHLQHQTLCPRVMYSVYGAVIYNFGITLFWATTKMVLPNCKYVRCAFGICSGIAALAIGKQYFKMLDASITEE